MAKVASQFFGSNVVSLLEDMGGAETWHVDLEDAIVRAALVTHGGEVLPPPPPPEPSPAAPKKTPTKPPPPDAKPQQKDIMKPTRGSWGNTLVGLLVIAALFVLGRFAPGEFLQHFTVFILACFVGWQVIWAVKPALHTPLMSVTNAISGIIILGGMLQASGGIHDLGAVLGAAAILVASINVFGGFLVTQRMLRMFRKDDRR